MRLGVPTALGRIVKELFTILVCSGAFDLALGLRTILFTVLVTVFFFTPPFARDDYTVAEASCCEAGGVEIWGLSPLAANSLGVGDCTLWSRGFEALELLFSC